jgi:hypothetical protein
MDYYREIELTTLSVGVTFRALGGPVSFPEEVVIPHGAFGSWRDDTKEEPTIFLDLVLQLKMEVDSWPEPVQVQKYFAAIRF